MTARKVWRWAKWPLVIGVAALGLRGVWHFPWHLTLHALRAAEPLPLMAALGINLVSLFSKGLAWHLLLRPVAPNRWWVAQEANLISSAASNLSVPVGEAARVHLISSREGVPVQTAVASVVWTRGVELLGLALLLLLAPNFQEESSPLVRGFQVGAGVVVMLVFALVWSKKAPRLLRLLPRFAQPTVVSLAEIGTRARLLWPTVLALVNWLTQWMTFHWTFLALQIPISYSASFAAVIATNVAGFLRLTPANFGILQTSMALVLLPFGVQPEQAVAAGLALQAIQVLPVLALAMFFTGWKGLLQMGSKEIRSAGGSSKSES